MCVDSLLEEKKKMTRFYHPGDDPRRYPKKNIFSEYCDVWKVSSSINNVKLRSYEQKLIELDSEDLKTFLQKYVVTLSLSKETCEIHKSSVLLHLIQIFCISGQEEKKELVKNYLNEWLHILTNEMRYITFKRYISQQLKNKSILKEIDLLAGQIDQQHEFMLKLCYLDTLCVENNHEGLKELLQQNADFFVSKIEELVSKYQMTFSKHEKTKVIFCMILLSILNWKLYNQKTASISLTVPITETQASSIVTFKPIKYLCTAHKVRSILQSLLSTLHADEIVTAFNAYLDQMYAMKSEITPDGLCIGETVSHHEFLLKLCYWKTICKNNDDEAIKKIIQLCPEVLVSHIEENVQQYEPNTKLYIHKTLLCILNWHICTLKKAQFLVQITEKQASQSVAILDDLTTNTIWRILKAVISTLSEEEIFTAFNEYLDQILTMKSEITEDDFCTGMIDPYHEFMMKLCYCEKLSNEHDDDETYRKFLRKNADFLATKIGKVVDGNNTKTKLISCKVLLCLVKWDLCNQKTAYTSLNNILSQMLTQKEYCQAFINENALFFVSMVRTVIKRNNIPLLISLCDVLLCIPNSNLHFYEVTGAVNKLIRYYVKQVGMTKITLQWILLFGYRILKHLNDYRKLDTALKTRIDIRKLCNLLEELSTDSMHERKALDLLIEALKDDTYPYHGNPNKYLQDFTVAQDAIKLEEALKGKQSNSKPYNLNPMLWPYFYDWTADYFTDFRNSIFNQMDDLIYKYRYTWVNMLTFFVMVCTVFPFSGHHSSDKLEKYLTFKHHYPMASLYLLWGSGDIEVHPGPCNEKKPLVYDSSIKRRWIPNACKMLDIKLSDDVQSKYREKKGRISDKEYRELFKDLLTVCHEEKVHVPKMFQAEILAWKTMEYKVLNKLFVCRQEIETIKASLHDYFTYGGSTKDLTDINVSIITELKTKEIAIVLGKDQKPIDKSQLTSHITRHIAGISIKCAHGKEPEVKCDGLVKQPLKNWTKDIKLFDPNNRVKYGNNLKPDQELVDNLIELPQITFPPKNKEVVDAYKVFRTTKTKQHKEELCNIFKRTTSLKNLDYALKSLCVNKIFTKEVHDILQKLWNFQTLHPGKNEILSQETEETEKNGRPHILIDISTKSITLTVEPKSVYSSKVSYVFPLNDELIKLETMATTGSPSSEETVTAKKYLKPTADKYPADIITNSTTIPQNDMTVLNTGFPCDLNLNRQKILESDIKFQHKMSSQETAICSTIHLDQQTSSTNQFSQPVSILCTNQSTNNSYDLGYVHICDNNVSQNLDLYHQVSPTSDMGSYDSISSVNSKSGNDAGDQDYISNGDQVLLTDSDYSSDSSNNFVSKTNIKKRKFTGEDRNETKKRKITSLKQDKKPKETNHRQMDCLMANTASFSRNREILPDWLLDSDLDSFKINDQTFKVDLNALDNEETELVKFLKDLFKGEGEKMSQMKSYNSDQ